MFQATWLQPSLPRPRSEPKVHINKLALLPLLGTTLPQQGISHPWDLVVTPQALLVKRRRIGVREARIRVATVVGLERKRMVQAIAQTLLVALLIACLAMVGNLIIPFKVVISDKL